jgi:cyclic pyranopterin phosphate synthase
MIGHAPTWAPIADSYGRQVGDLRLSVTDRCNLRCAYCILEEMPQFQLREELLTFEKMERLASLVCKLGVTKVRLTGGEPLLRRKEEGHLINSPDFVRPTRTMSAIGG